MKYNIYIIYIAGVKTVIFMFTWIKFPLAIY